MTSMFSHQRQEAELRRLHRVKQMEKQPSPMLGPEVVGFFKHSVEKRQKKFGRIAEAWQQLVPPLLADHCALESFVRGSLTVIVDSSSHLYDLKQLLLAGLEKQLVLASASASLRKVILKPGRWYNADPAGDRKLQFE